MSRSCFHHCPRECSSGLAALRLPALGRVHPGDRGTAVFVAKALVSAAHAVRTRHALVKMCPWFCVCRSWLVHPLLRKVKRR